MSFLSRPWPFGDQSAWINVKAHGAVGDGNHDDLPAIMDAIAAIPLAGGVLIFPQGVYWTSGPIYIRDRSAFTIFGYGAAICIQDKLDYSIDLSARPIPYDGGKNNPREFSVLEIFNCSDWYLAGLLLDGNYRHRPVPGQPLGTKPSILEHSHGINLAGCHRFTVESVAMQYCQGDGIMLTGMNQAGFVGASTPASNCSEFTLHDITVHNVARNSVSFVGARNGCLDKLLDYEIGTDWDPAHKIYNSAIAGDYAGVEFEVDGGEEYEQVEDITCTNLDMRNHRTIAGILGSGAASVLNFSARANHCVVTNFRYEQQQPNTGQQSIVTVGGANNITLLNGLIEVRNADNAKGMVYGILLQGQDEKGTGVQNVAIEHVAIDGPITGIRVSQGCKDIRITDNSIRNCYRTGLWLEGECRVTGNYLRDMGNWFVETQLSSTGGVATCEGNVLANTLPTNASANYYFQVVNGSRLMANYNKCYGLSGLDLNHFGADPISFLENKFDGTNDGLIGTFTWPTGVAMVTVPNTNVTKYTQVLVFPIEQAAIDFVKANALDNAPALKPYESFTISTNTGASPPESMTFGYRLF